MNCNDSETVLDVREVTLRALMSEYDALPPEYRKFLQECPYQIMFKRDPDGTFNIKNIRDAEEILPDLIKENARLVYGDSHPQAM